MEMDCLLWTRRIHLQTSSESVHKEQDHYEVNKNHKALDSDQTLEKRNTLDRDYGSCTVQIQTQMHLS